MLMLEGAHSGEVHDSVQVVDGDSSASALVESTSMSMSMSRLADEGTCKIDVKGFSCLLPPFSCVRTGVFQVERGRA